MTFKKIKQKFRDLLGTSKIVKNLILKLPTGFNLECRLNGITVILPIEILKNYINCCHCKDEYLLDLFIEPHCSEWLVEKLVPGDVVLDIGAAFGVISLPLSKAVGNHGLVYAFEPALNTQKILKRVISANRLDNVKLVDKAVSNTSGESEFVEYSPENEFDWAPDTSTLDTTAIDESLIYEKYKVELTTIDAFVKENEISPKAIKMDIEGFEVYGLEGANKTLATHHPYLCIDIHKDVKTLKSSLEPVQSFLSKFGYRWEYHYHTLFAYVEN